MENLEKIEENLVVHTKKKTPLIMESKIDITVFRGMEPDNFRHCGDKIVNALKNPPFHFLIIGQVGTGKTMFSKTVMRRFMEHSKIPPCSESKWFLKSAALYESHLRLIRNNSGSDKGDAIENNQKVILGDIKRCAGNIVLDDIGTERGGESSPFIGGLLERRYDFIKKHGNKASTIITTNLGLGNGDLSIRKTYGERVLDRLIEMFNIIIFEDRRYRSCKADIWKAKQ
jgi:DNA replication protein DnaC